MSNQRVDFADRVMTAVGDQPAPSAARSMMAAVRTRSLADAFSAFSVAWHLGTVRRWSVAPRVRVQAIALVLTVLVALGFASIATATAVRLAVTGVNELGNVINHQIGTDEQGDVQNGSPGAGTGQDRGSGAKDGQPGAQGGEETSRPSDLDQPGVNQDDSGGAPGTDGGNGADGADGSSGADSSDSGQENPTP